MADELDILTLVEAKAALNIGLGDNDYDLELEQVITAASRLVDDIAGPVVQRTVTTEAHTGYGDTVRLNLTPVSSVTTVAEYAGSVSTTLTAETTPGLAGAGYLLADGTTHGARLIRRSGGYDTYWTAGRSNVLVTYVAGRVASTAAVDPIFKAAAVAALNHLWQARGAGSGTAVPGAEGPAFGAVPFSVDVLRKRLRAMLGGEALPPAVG